MFLSRTILRNMVLLTALIGTLLIVSSEDASAAIWKLIGVPSLHDAIDDIAYADGLAFCQAWPLGSDPKVALELYVYADKRCPVSPVYNRAEIRGVIGGPVLQGFAEARVMANDEIFAQLIVEYGCNGNFWERINEFPWVCNTEIIVPLPPGICYICTPPFNPGGCNTCEYSWMSDAECSGPFDPSCPL